MNYRQVPGMTVFVGQVPDTDWAGLTGSGVDGPFRPRPYMWTTAPTGPTLPRLK